jgi:hypothetical protein
VATTPGAGTRTTWYGDNEYANWTNLERIFEMPSQEYRRGHGHGTAEGHDWAMEMSMDGWIVSKGDVKDHAADQVRQFSPDGDWADGWYAGFVAGATK